MAATRHIAWGAPLLLAAGPVRAAEEEGGLPQLDFSTFPNQIFWLVVALVAIYLILSRIALPRIGATLAERSGTISNDLAAAEDLKARAAEAEKAYEKALADARAEARGIADEARAEIQKELDAAIAEADARIAERAAESEEQIATIRDSATASVREVARETAQAIVAAMGVEADRGMVDAAVETRMEG
ncbi:F-type H+-transporting ATPase subunit b [Hasllibacter halocynthiae]|uniref:ATP synthase subunit b n=1 Tax=Hasllibacter halocynthiae TaxID=595589 RepID=A0A2T0X3P2_9RHOB|nr:F0F1 ATP synthase subunit B' [Hasllibacter halocynthiae]PRY93551.1 F-type H+-transporting ATPase subunit b [Hasllibacter halocynthiae]